MVSGAELVGALGKAGVVVDAELFEFCETWKVGEEFPVVFCEGVFLVFKGGSPVVDRGKVVDVLGASLFLLLVRALEKV